VDKSSAQTIGGAKKFTDDLTMDAAKKVAFEDASTETTTRIDLEDGFRIEMYWS